MPPKILIISAKQADVANLISGLQTEIANIQIETKSLPQTIFRLGLPGVLEAWLCYVIGLFCFLPAALSQRKNDWYLLTDNYVTVPYLLLIRLFRNRNQKILAIHFFLYRFPQNLIKRKILTYLLNNSFLLLVVWNEQEKEYFSRLECKCQVEYFPYCQPAPRCSGISGKNSSYLFSGGSSNRDYDCILDAVEDLDHKVIIICSRINNVTRNLPNVEILCDVSEDEFLSYLKNSKAVIVSLKEEIISSGQMVVLSSMAFGKAIIYSDVPAVSQYFTDGFNGLAFQKGNATDLARKLQSLLLKPAMLETLGTNARLEFERSYGSARLMRFISSILTSRRLAERQNM